MPDSDLTREEQETIISWDASSKTAYIFTCNPSTRRKLDKLSAEFPDAYKTVKRDEYGGAWYEAPISLIRFGKPASEAQKAMGKLRAKNLTRLRMDKVSPE